MHRHDDNEASQCCRQGVAAAMAYAKSMATLDRPDLGGPCKSILRVVRFDAAAADCKSDGGQYVQLVSVSVVAFATVRRLRLSGVDRSPHSTTKVPIVAKAAMVIVCSS
jgi:hypothetical protein